MAGKSKTIIKGIEREDEQRYLTEALGAKFTVFQFKLQGTDIVAEGPWELPANQRPALGTVQTWAEGYAQSLADHR